MVLCQICAYFRFAVSQVTRAEANLSMRLLESYSVRKASQARPARGLSIGLFHKGPGRGTRLS
jgi:hypothetical protein